MSRLILPPGVQIPTVEALQAPDPNAQEDEASRVIPKPTGFRLLCVVPKAKDKFDGTSIVKADMVIAAEEQTSHVLFVLKLGPDAYKDKTRFSEPWCKEGDFVVVRAYAGTRFKIFGQEFRLINDDQVDGVVDDPRGITRAGG